MKSLINSKINIFIEINFQTVKPTIGYNYERIEYEGTTFGIWDVSGNDDVAILILFELRPSQKKIKFLPLIKTFYENIKINATIFLIRFDIDVFDPEPVLGKGMIQTEGILFI